MTRPNARWASGNGAGGLAAAAFAVAAGAVSLLLSWQRWINPFIDSCRELDVPRRLANGERLYRDVTYFYGPVAPWVNALLVRSLGRRWVALEILGLFGLCCILLLLYRLTGAAGGRVAATVAVALAAAVCVGAPSGGSFVFPYCFDNLFAIAGGLAACVAALRLRGWSAGVGVGLGVAIALLARIEIGIGVAAVILICALRRYGLSAQARTAAIGVGGAPIVAGLVYWSCLSPLPFREAVAAGPLIFLSLPAEWLPLYRSIAGISNPLRIAAKLGISTLMDGGILAGAALLARWRAGGRGKPRVKLWAAAGVFLVALVGVWLAWQKWQRAPYPLVSPFLPIPLLAGVGMVACLLRPTTERRHALALLFGFVAATSLRVVFAFSLGPRMDVYCSTAAPGIAAATAALALDWFPRYAKEPRLTVQHLILAFGVTMMLFFLTVARTSWGTPSAALATPAGHLRLPQAQASALEAALSFLSGRARPGDSLATFPEGGFFNFVLGLRNPLLEEQILPGMVDARREDAILRRLLGSKCRFVILCNRPTTEFGKEAFGRDYAIRVWRGVLSSYQLRASFGHAPSDAAVGYREFFIRIYELRDAPVDHDLPGVSVLPHPREGLFRAVGRID